MRWRQSTVVSSPWGEKDVLEVLVQKALGFACAKLVSWMWPSCDHVGDATTSKEQNLAWLLQKQDFWPCSGENGYTKDCIPCHLLFGITECYNCLFCTLFFGQQRSNWLFGKYRTLPSLFGE